MTTMTLAPTESASVSMRKLQPAPMRWQPEMVPVLSLPGEMLDRYIEVALRSAVPHEIDGGHWYCELQAFPGVWADGESPKQCLDTLDEVLREWLVVKLVKRDTDVPIIDEIDLTAISRRR